jgi:hypothetical protein
VLRSRALEQENRDPLGTGRFPTEKFPARSGVMASSGVMSLAESISCSQGVDFLLAGRKNLDPPAKTWIGR